MPRFPGWWMRMLRREHGQDLAEYALLIPVVVLLMLVINALTGGIGNAFNSIREALDTTGRVIRP